MENEKNTKSNNSNTVKIALIAISFLIAIFSAFRGYVLTTVEGDILGLTSLTPFYIYTATMLIAFVMAKKNNNIIANIMIILSILTYGWTFLFVQYLIKTATDVHIIIHPFFYIYLSSSIFLIIALFFNVKKEKIIKEEKTSIQEVSNGIEESISKDNLIFAKIILGLKEIPYNTEALLVNNVPDNTLDIIYAIDNNNQTIKIPIKSIKNISYKQIMKMQNVSKEVEDNETKSMLLSAAVFGGNPLLQLAGNSVFNTMLDGSSKNYDKVNYNSAYEITLETIINNEEVRFILETASKPELFIKQINETINNNT